MAPSRSYVVEAALGDGLVIHMQSLRPSLWLNAAKLGGEQEGDDYALRYALRKVGSKEVSFHDLRSRQALDAALPGRAYFAAKRVFGQLHDPKPRHLDQAVSTVQVEDGPDGQRWTVFLADHRLVAEAERDPGGGRAVVLQQMGRVEIRAAVEQARNAAREPAAREFAAVLNQIKGAVVEVSGKPYPGGLTDGDLDALFSVPECLVLAYVWQELHIGTNEGTLEGNLRPVPQS